MSNITVDKIVGIGNRLIVKGTVDGVSVTEGELPASKIHNAKSEEHKKRYIEEALLSGAPLSSSAIAALRGHSIWLRPFFWVWANAPIIIVNGVITYLLIHFAR